LQRNEAAACCSKRRAHGYLAASRRCPEQDEPRDVGAAQQQHGAAHRQQQLEAVAGRIEYAAARLPARAGLEHERSRTQRLALLLVDIGQDRRFDFAQDRAIESVHRGG